MTKTCRVCKQVKSADQFYHHKRTCKPCYIENVTANGWNLRPKYQPAVVSPHSIKWTA